MMIELMEEAWWLVGEGVHRVMCNVGLEKILVEIVDRLY